MQCDSTTQFHIIDRINSCLQAAQTDRLLTDSSYDAQLNRCDLPAIWREYVSALNGERFRVEGYSKHGIYVSKLEAGMYLTLFQQQISISQWVKHKMKRVEENDAGVALVPVITCENDQVVKVNYFEA